MVKKCDVFLISAPNIKYVNAYSLEPSHTIFVSKQKYKQIKSQQYENTPMQYTAIFHGCKNVHFQIIIFLIFFLIFAQNIDCGYTLEPPQ